MPETKKKRKGNLVIFLFPYLFIDKEWEIDGFKFKPSYKETIDKESNRVRGHLHRIAKSFSYRYSANIFQYTYGHVTVHNEDEWKKLKATLDIIATLLRYQELSSERTGADFSNFDYVAIEISMPLRRDDIVFYKGVLNGSSELNIHYPRTKFCPNHELRPHVYLTESDGQIANKLLYLAKLHTRSVSEKQRLLRALECFNKSFKSEPEIDDYERFINIGIAFETLFNSPEYGIVPALTTGITTLLGETEEMTHWIKKFYEVRCDIAHGREEPIISYKGNKSNEFHLNHLLFARKVFSKCIDAIFISREKVYTEDLHNELISNERRLREVLEGFKKHKTIDALYDAGVFKNIESLSQRDISGKSSDVRKIAKQLLPFVRKIIEKNKDTKMLELLDCLVKDEEQDLGDLAVKYSDFHSGFSPYYFGDKTISTKGLKGLVLKAAVYELTSFAGWKLMHSAFNNRDD